MITIRYATEEDAKALLDIYAPYVRETAITFEYEVPTLEEFTERIHTIGEKYPYILAQEDGCVLGYAYAHEFKNRAAYDWAVETTIYVDRNHKKSGIGRILYEKLEQLLKEMNVYNVNACIAYPTAEDKYLTKNSEEFHKHMGYQTVGTFHKCGYKFDTWYDMIWMEKMLGEHPSHPEPLRSIKELRTEMSEPIQR